MHTVLIVVFDGLQPTQVNPGLMPNLSEYAARGVTFSRHHPVYPTVTRTNAASMVTGRVPGGHGQGAAAAPVCTAARRARAPAARPGRSRRRLRR